ncbi:MAG: hypothetical protein K6G42_03180 [Lachnospiraceae bacterium]|nr:hypothetical protein [Lachnospiraceae bacterium]
MSVEAYINPDFGWTEKLFFLIAAVLGISVCVFIVLLVAKLSRDGDSYYDRSRNRVQRFYELIISGTSVMSFACSYVILNHIYSILQGQDVPFTSIWENWKDFILLLLICLSCVLNTLLDRLIIPLRLIDKGEKASIRMLSMFYAIFILVFLNLIGDESEYSPVMMYYLGLMVGRFVYFDASFTDFIEAVKNLFRNLPLLLLGLGLTGILTFLGFDWGYLLERNYYIVGIFYTQLFMLVSVFILHHSHILDLLIRKPAEDTGDPSSDEYAYDDGYDDLYEDEDDEDYRYDDEDDYDADDYYE